MPSDGIIATRRPVPDSMFGGRLRGAYLLDLEVVDINDLASHVRCIAVASTDLVGFEHSPGQDLMIEFHDEGRPVNRRYSIRRSDPDTGLLELLFELHHSGGVATQWAAEAVLGDRLNAIGPRGTVALDYGAAVHVFIADDSAMPAAFAMLEALPAEASAIALLVTPYGPLSRPGPQAVADVRQHWLEEFDLKTAIAGLDLTAPVAAYVNGEHHLVRRASALLMSSGIDKTAIAAKSYWRSDQSNAPHGEPPRD